METHERNNGGIQRLEKFLPYLWGMETNECSDDWVQGLGSYRTYEEWKLIANIDGYIPEEDAFLPYLWGMETRRRK